MQSTNVFARMAMSGLVLLGVGATVTHRATPAFRYPTPLDDAQRAVRFIRHNAAKYGIDATRIGGSGGSSGAHLVSMLATMDGTGDPNDSDAVNRESAKLQCIVARAAPIDLPVKLIRIEGGDHGPTFQERRIHPTIKRRW